MIKLITSTALLLLLTALGAHSQSSKPDTVCLPIAQAKRVLARAEQGKADSIELLIRKTEISELRNISASQQMTIANLNDRVSVQQLAVTNAQAQVQALNREVKKQKRKTVLTAIAGVLASGGLAYLFIAK